MKAPGTPPSKGQSVTQSRVIAVMPMVPWGKEQDKTEKGGRKDESKRQLV